MIDVDSLIKKIIPYPADYSHRDGFNNELIIDNLESDEKESVEVALINLLDKHPEDTLIVETLAYLKSVKSIPILYDLLKKCSKGVRKLKIATSIFQINQDTDLMDIAISETKQMDDKKDPYYIYKLTSAFYSLAKFQNENANNFIESYVTHDEPLISYNAKRALTIYSKK